MSFLDEKYPALAAVIGDDYRLLGHDRAKCRCPNYARHKRGDSHFSLLVKVGDKTGSAVMKCMAGCTNPEILQSSNLKFRDICANAPKDNRIMSTLTKVYEYCDPDGNPVLQVARYHPKAFKPRRRLPQCRDGWVYNINGGIVKRVHDQNEESNCKWIDSGKRPDMQPDKSEVSIPAWEQWPYNAHVVASCPERMILWHEGEGCADITMELGFVSTSTQGGANNRVFRREWAKLFRGRHVVLFPDHDAAGSQYARYYAGCLMEAKAASITFLRLPKLPDGGDVKDWAFGVRQGAEDVGPDSTPARELRRLIANETGYGRTELKKLFGTS